MLKINLQKFAEDTEPVQKPEATKEPAKETASTPAQGKVWTDEYVQGLREEAKNHRLAKKAYEAKLRSLLGLKEDEEISDDRITQYQQSQSKAIEEAILKANDRLIKAEIKSLEGYDTKLVERLLDKSKLTINEDGTVTGLKEAVETLATEFPQIT